MQMSWLRVFFSRLFSRNNSLVQQLLPRSSQRPRKPTKMDQQQQQQPPPQSPMVKLTSKNHRALPILDYYLTFIHYFGFGINPDDDHRARYLSIRVKRAQTQHTAARNSTATLGQNQPDQPQPHLPNHQQWIASYTRRAQRKIHSLPFPLFAYLKTTVKYMAITFNTFIATNHCIVLVDYICSGSREIEDIILDIRLVITKLSALIFVLSWHHKRYEVRQLIKLVKSTSLYILATHGQRLQCPHSNGGAGGEHTVASSLSQPLLAPESPVPSPTVAANTMAPAAHFPAVANKPNKTNLLLTRQQQQQQQQQNGTGANNCQQQQELVVSDEIGSSLRMDTSAFDKRILKGWFGCLLIIIVHFSLSEAEISKSHHLWQWLDDYSLHQLGNQSISYQTLMVLATFDNYIYTVHVYGTRLIGASIICIVCSLQHEVIKSLNLYTLRLIQPSQQPLLRAIGCGGGGGSSAPSGGDTMSISSKLSESASQSQSCSTVGSQISLLSGENFELDSSTFFVLGESDWFRVQYLRQQLEPRGHLTASIWRAWLLPWRWLGGLMSSAGARAQDWLRLVWNWALRGCRHQEESVRVAAHDNNNNNNSNNKRPVNLRRVTPKSEHKRSSTQVTLGQVASSLIRNSNGEPRPRACSPSRKRPTPLTLSAPMMQAGGGGGNPAYLTKRFMHANSRDSRFQFFTNTTAAASPAQLKPGDRFGFASAHTALCWSSPLRSSDEYQARLMSMIGGGGGGGGGGDVRLPELKQPDLQTITGQSGIQWAGLDAGKIELQMERLSTKYELVRTVNTRIDACFGPMLLIQFSFLFLMSCIDLVYFSLCFKPNTKTKYIIIAGMILLWCPYMLIYKFASDMGSSSKELLVSIRRLARLYLLEDQARMASDAGRLLLGSNCVGGGPGGLPTEQHLWSAFRVESTNRILYNNHLLASSTTKQLPMQFAPAAAAAGTKIGAGIVDKLDHIFKPTHLSIMGLMTVDKFFLLNFAKIVITSSVMMIQFISN